MKKAVTLVMLLIVMSCLALLLFTACVPKSLSAAVYENLSDYRTDIFAGKNEELKANYTIGMRESTYEYDGKHTENVEFGILSVIFSNGMNSARVPFKLIVDDVEFEGNLEKNPFTSEYMTDISTMAVFEEIYLEVYVDENISLTLTNQTKDWKIDAPTALKKGIALLENDLKAFMSGGQFLAETYLKITYDQRALVEGYFWNFGVVGQNGKKANVMIDVDSGELLAKM